jgi:putative membrane protein
LIIRFIVNAVALWVAAELIPGLHIEGLAAILIVATIFGVVNAFIRPLVLVFTCLINLLSLGLFTLIINAAMLWLTSLVAQSIAIDFRVDDFVSAFLGALLISLVSFALTRLTR